MPIKTLDFEERIERDIDRVVEAARAADRSLWLAGKLAYRIVGKYKVNATKDIALKVGRSESTVENWAHAAELFFDLACAGYGRAVWSVRNSLSPTHFWRMWDLRNKYDLTNEKVMLYFSIVLSYREIGQPHGVKVLEGEVEAGENKNGNTPGFSFYKSRFQSIYAGLILAKDTPADVAKWLQSAPESIKVTK